MVLAVTHMRFRIPTSCERPSVPPVSHATASVVAQHTHPHLINPHTTHIGVPVNSKNRKGLNALMQAAAGGHADTVELLIKRAANVLATNQKVGSEKSCVVGRFVGLGLGFC